MNWKRGWKRRILCLAVGLVVLAALLLMVERWRGSQSLSNRYGELIQSGERLLVSELQPLSFPQQSNALSTILSLSNETKRLVNLLSPIPPSGRSTTNGSLVMATRLKRWKSDQQTNDWDKVHAALVQEASVVAAVEGAVNLPGWDETFPYAKGFIDFSLPGLVEVRRAAQVLQVAALSELQRGNSTAAHAQLKHLLRLVKHQGNSSLVISQLVRISCGTLAWNVTWEGLQADQWDSGQLTELQQLWSEFEYRADMRRSLEMERAMTITNFALLAANPAELVKQVGLQREVAALVDLEDGLPTGAFLTRWFHAPIWRFAWRHQDELRALNRWQAIVETDRSVANGSWLSANERLKQLSEASDSWLGFLDDSQSKPGLYDRWRYLLSSGPFSINSVAVLKAHKADAQRTMMITVITLQRYRIAHGSYPEHLNELVPRFLDSEPVDFADGQRLRYHPAGESYLLYSVGGNFSDEGGDSRANSNEYVILSMWEGLDAVWPRPASPEEIADLKLD